MDATRTPPPLLAVLACTALVCAALACAVLAPACTAARPGTVFADDDAADAGTDDDDGTNGTGDAGTNGAGTDDTDDAGTDGSNGTDDAGTNGSNDTDDAGTNGSNGTDDAGTGTDGTDDAGTGTDGTDDAGTDGTDIACATGDGNAGTCVDVDACIAPDFTATAGLCPGATNIQCCTPTPNVADNPPVPAGFRLMQQAEVTSEMTAFAIEVLHDPVTYPMFATVTRAFGDVDVLARVEWHPPDFNNGAIHRGVTLYVPL